MAKDKTASNQKIEGQASPELQMQRLLSWSSYNDFLEDTDSKLLAQYQKTIRQLQVAFWMNVIMSGVIFVLSIASIIYGIIFMQESDPSDIVIGGSIAAIGLIIILIILYRSPFNNIRHSTSNMAKISIILMGFVRQINQVDMAYKQVLFTSSQVDPKETHKTIQSIQEIVEQSVDEVSRSLENMI